MAGQLETLIINEANNTNVTEENKTHHDICVQIKEYAEQNDIPYWLVAIVAVSSSAHKIPTFNKGYKSINLEYANKVFGLTKKIADKFNRPSLRTNVRTTLACGRFVRLKGKMGDFKSALAKVDELPKELNTSKEFLQLLFKDMYTFNDSGNLIATQKEGDIPKAKEEKTKKKERTPKVEKPTTTETPTTEVEVVEVHVAETPTTEVEATTQAEPTTSEA